MDLWFLILTLLMHAIPDVTILVNHKILAEADLTYIQT